LGKRSLKTKLQIRTPKYERIEDEEKVEQNKSENPCFIDLKNSTE
jgi:hypothetical protein